MMSLPRTLAALAALALAACTQSHAPGEITPLLYAVSDADSTMYLYGTVHVRPRGADWSNARVRTAIDESEEVWTELIMSPEADAQTQVLAQQLGRAPPGRPLSSWLNAEENERLNGATARIGLPAGALEGLQPWAAALTLTVVPLMQAGFDPQSSVDRSIDAYADAAGKRMRALETPEQQLRFFDTMSPELQREMLLEAIEQVDEVAAMITAMSETWEEGDEAALARVVIEETRAEYPELYETLFVVRNNAWMEELTREMEGAGVDFVAVGAGHVIGRDGLAAQFRARGYRVQRVR
ncbi:MAG: TraB/GumN family protein [Caulobacteraceae bacterium]